jgi:sulfur-carrier protein
VANPTNKMTILFFAILKEHFPPAIQIKGDLINNCQQLKEHLVSLNKAAEPILNSCRFAVNNKFITDEFTLEDTHTIAIIPPSSGG